MTKTPAVLLAGMFLLAGCQPDYSAASEKTQQALRDGGFFEVFPNANWDGLEQNIIKACGLTDIELGNLGKGIQDGGLLDNLYRIGVPNYCPDRDAVFWSQRTRL